MPGLAGFSRRNRAGFNFMNLDASSGLAAEVFETPPIASTALPPLRIREALDAPVYVSRCRPLRFARLPLNRALRPRQGRVERC
jgi:hypothetical protein